MIEKNILAQASRLIPLKPYQYRAFNSNTINDVGIIENTYSHDDTIHANIQPVPRSVYEQFGLDLQRNYYTIFVSENLFDLQREVSGDQVIFDNRTLQLESNTADWINQYGYNSYLAVQID